MAETLVTTIATMNTPMTGGVAGIPATTHPMSEIVVIIITTIAVADRALPAPRAMPSTL